MKDQTTENITQNVKITNNQAFNPRVRFVFERLVTHLHDFAREVQLSDTEWTAAIAFLTTLGKQATEMRNDLILLSDTLGLSLLVDAINHPKKPTATEGTVLGPFHTHDAVEKEHGAALHIDPDATPLLSVCSVRDEEGNPIPDVVVDIWEGDSHGIYDVQREDRAAPDGRAVLRSDSEGKFFFTAIVPVPYPIPDDGPIGDMLRLLGRKIHRPSHIHFLLRKPGWDTLTTALYTRGDPYESSDPVFGVKESLLVDYSDITDPEVAKQYNVPIGTKLLQHNFVLITEKDALLLKRENAAKNMAKFGVQKMTFLDGLPVPDVD